MKANAPTNVVKSGCRACPNWEGKSRRGSCDGDALRGPSTTYATKQEATKVVRSKQRGPTKKRRQVKRRKDEGEEQAEEEKDEEAEESEQGALVATVSGP